MVTILEDSTDSLQLLRITHVVVNHLKVITKNDFLNLNQLIFN